MRIMVLGAGGFIGRQIVAELLSGSHDVVGVVRQIGGLSAAFPQVQFVAVDLARAVDPVDWQGLLDDIDVVVNAAGLLRGRAMEAVHVAMPKALCAAALAARTRRMVLISAISARADVATDYARSKLAGETAVRASGIETTILRPSLVYGDGSYGGTSLMRGMAGLPLAIPIPGDGHFAFTPIHARDLARAVRIVCENPGFAGQTLEPVGPETMTLRDLLGRYRAWLGFGAGRFLPVPMPVMRILGRLGDVFGDGPVSTNSLAQMVAGNAGDSTVFASQIGFAPRSLDQALCDRPAQTQDRWHSRLFFLAFALKAILILLWLASSWLGLAHGTIQTGAVVQHLGLAPAWADPLRIGSSAMDLVIAGLVAFDRTGRWSTPVQLFVVLGYTLVIGTALPGLWLDPLGPLLKNLPILMTIAVHGAIADRR